MPPEQGVRSGTALGGRALEINLSSSWSDSANYGCSGGSDVTEAVDCCGNFKKKTWLLGHISAFCSGSIFDHYSIVGMRWMILLVHMEDLEKC